MWRSWAGASGVAVGGLVQFKAVVGQERVDANRLGSKGGVAGQGGRRGSRRASQAGQARKQAG